MDLTVIRQQALSKKSAKDKAEALLLAKRVYRLSTEEWRNLVAGVPTDVITQIGALMSTDGALMSTGTQGHCVCQSDQRGMTLQDFGTLVSLFCGLKALDP